MMLSFNTCHFLLVVTAAFNAVAFATEPIDLGLAGAYTILAEAAISSVPNSSITGDIAISPAAATYITGFSLALDSSTQFSTSAQVTGTAVAASYGAPISETLTQAVLDMQAAYTDAGSRATTTTNLGTPAGSLGGMTLTPGVHTFDVVLTIGDDLVFDAQGDSSAIFIVRTTGYLQQATGTRVFLVGGALASNIFWKVDGYVQINVDAHMEGIILGKTKIVMQTRASLNGRALAQTAVTLDMVTIAPPVPADEDEEEDAELFCE
jgi:hypothetical protein